MAVNWTDEQREAIEAKGGNILVAAAAGSGKTAVLVERIIRKITDSENPVPVDRLLVLTFTEAAAAEMKRKISDAIDKKLDELPDNEWLKEQSIRVNSACISTIHSFCSRIITNNAHLTDLPSGFSLIDPTENDVLLDKALNDVLESYYSRIDKKEGFKELVTGWGGIKGDDDLRKTILRLHQFSQSLPYPKKWLHNVWYSGYGCVAKAETADASVWKELLASELYIHATDVAESLELIWELVDASVPSDHAYYGYYAGMKEQFCPAFEKINPEADDYFERIKALLEGFVVPRAPRKTGLEDTPIELINSLRDDIVKDALKKAEELISAIDEENTARIIKCSPVVRTLCMIVRQVERVHTRYKREKNAIDFNDLEHGLLRLISSDRGVETPLCRRLREYYDEILLDEFQDTNVLQFEIFSRLSKKEGNLFMVGDVKQCIYKFRNAAPDIFLSLYRAYGEGDGGRLIRLFKNFRSRNEVVDAVNCVFSGVMSERVGGIDYTGDEYLIRGAKYPDGNGFETEIMITDMTEEYIYTPEGKETELNEAENIADRIYRLVRIEKMLVTDKQTGELRPARFGDIAVLSRNKAEGSKVEEALLRRGISAISETGQRYLDSVEVMTVLSFLQIIDNPIQDIPLVAVMRSPMFSFSPDELADIRSKAKRCRYYFALKEAAKENEKAADFLNTLNELRSCSKYMGVDELARKICFDLHYMSLVGAMPGGDLRRANLKLLLEKCSAYEQGSLTGLFNFMKYIEMLRDNKKDLAPAREAEDALDVVSIMTMHKSKGLEFPIVVIASTSKKFNVLDIDNNIIWDEKFGLGLDYIDTRQRVRYSFPVKKIVANEKRRQLVDEEMRLLYVAMTRAKEKLIISATIHDNDNRWKDIGFEKSGRVYPCVVAKMNSMRDWILSSLMSHPYANILRDAADRWDIKPDMRKTADIRICTPEKVDLEYSDARGIVRAQSTVDVTERLDYVYPYAVQGRMPIKLSVSELKRRQMPEEDFSTGLLKPPRGFLNDETEMSATEKGTVTHFVLQHMDIYKSETIDDISAQIEDMIKSGMITQKQGDAVNKESIYQFLSGELGARLKAAEKFERELDFYMFVPPGEVDKSVSDDEAEDVILQGIADCIFYEDDGIVLLDYKTDRIGKDGAEKRSEMYKIQIDYYARGLSEMLDMPVKEKYLYFLNCGEAVKM